MVERMLSMHEAQGSIPCFSTFFFSSGFEHLTIKKCLDRGSNTGPLDLQSNALPTELSKQVMVGKSEYCQLKQSWCTDVVV